VFPSLVPVERLLYAVSVSLSFSDLEANIRLAAEFLAAHIFDLKAGPRIFEVRLP
jgi:hypothetical protein